LKDEKSAGSDEKLTSDLMKIIIDLRRDARDRKEWALSDNIRAELKKAGIILNDVKDGATWERE
jgi:cysteinyl-tRNA synthetase